MFSDHGMNLEENRRVDLATTLGRQGFQVVGQFTKNRRREVSIPAFGLCSYAAAYCGDDEVVPDVARGLTEITGVDFVVYKNGSEVVLESSRGSARIERHANSYRYVSVKGDPLELEATIRTLREQGKLDQRVSPRILYGSSRQARIAILMRWRTSTRRSLHHASSIRRIFSLV